MGIRLTVQESSWNRTHSCQWYLKQTSLTRKSGFLTVFRFAYLRDNHIFSRPCLLQMRMLLGVVSENTLDCFENYSCWHSTVLFDSDNLLLNYGLLFQWMRINQKLRALMMIIYMTYGIDNLHLLLSTCKLSLPLYPWRRAEHLQQHVAGVG